MIETIVQAPLIAKLCALALVLLVGYFALRFIPRALKRWSTLNRIISGLKGLEEGADPAPLFEKYQDLKHLWGEFDESLFEQQKFDSVKGGYVLDRKRSTVPAEQFFSTQLVVDSYVGAEFFRHLPGILTGIGIIGTFFGILHGLALFNVSDNAQLVRQSLSGLLHSVSEAFLVSAFAIFLAMLITLVEKALLAKLYQKTEELVFELDARYTAGAGEQMLQDLLHASKESVAHNKTLRDTLVNDLKGILESLIESQIQAQQRIIEQQVEAQQRIVEQQIQAQNESTEKLGRQIGLRVTEGIKAALDEPLKDIKDAVKTVGGERTGAVHTLLTEVVQGLNQSLKDLFGDQIAGINTMQKETIAALQTAVGRMEQMSASLETAGTRATDAMADKLKEAITGMEARQEVMARNMAQIVEEMKATVANSQTQTNERMSDMLVRVSTTVETLVSTLSQSVANSQDATNEKLQSALAGVTQAVETLIASLSQTVATSQTETNTKLQDTLASVSNAVEKLVTGLSGSVAATQAETNTKLQDTLANVSTTVEKLVSGLSESVAATQAKSNTHLEQAVSSVGDTVNSVMSELRRQAATADAAHLERQNQLAAEAATAAAGIRTAVETLAAEVRTLVAGTRSAVDSMRSSVDSMRTVTTEAVSRMNSGAETLYVASSEFSKAGTAVTGSLQQATSLTDRLAAAAGSVGTASQTMQSIVNDYRAKCDQLATMLAELSKVVENASMNASLTSDVLSQIRKATEALSEVPFLPAGFLSTTQLLPHQNKGVAWLQHLFLHAPTHCRGAVIADDMGLGKTLQLLTFLARAFEDNPSLPPALVVAPVSLLENWEEEMSKFFRKGTFRPLIAYGDNLASLRVPRAAIDAELRKEELLRFLRPGWVGNANIVLTTYETLRDLEFSFAKQQWSIMACDEAQKIKNPNAMVTRAAKKQNVMFKIACTGTPVENTLVDLWCLFDLVQAGYLGALNEFGKRYRKPIEAETDEEKARVAELRRLIEPQILRRMKADVAELPPRHVQPTLLPMSRLQRSFYTDAVNGYMASKDKTRAEPVVSPFKNHLGLLQYLRSISTMPHAPGLGRFKPQALEQARSEAPKLAWLLDTLEQIRQKGEKAIVFAEFREAQQMLAYYIEKVFGYKPDIINGDVTASAKHVASRQKRIRAFQDKPGFGVIILSPVAVGFGVNVQAANHVIHYTRNWNPAKEDQATDRAYRIGQTREVWVYLPIVSAEFTTFEMRLNELLEFKRELANDMLNGADPVMPGDWNLQDIVPGGANDTVFNRAITLDDVLRMEWDYFEAYVAAVWQKKGFRTVYRTPAKDGGVDVVAFTSNAGDLIQCKSSSTDNSSLNDEGVKDVIGAEAEYRLRHPGVNFSKWAATNQFFNDTAREKARHNKVTLVTQPDIERWLRDYPVTDGDIQRFLHAYWDEAA